MAGNPVQKKEEQEWWAGVMSKIREQAAIKAQKIVQALWKESLSEAIQSEISSLSALRSEDLVRQLSSNQADANRRKIGLAPIVPTNDPIKNAVFEVDEIFLSIVRDYVKSITAHARSSTEFILKVSGNFLNIKAQTALNDFHSLYFTEGSSMSDASAEVNHEVDNMLKGIRDIIARNGNLDALKVAENQKDKIKRLSLSGLQKQLEMIIALDEGIKDKLLPVLSSMQFEDMLAHRLAHVVYLWEKIINHFRGGEVTELSTLVEELKTVPTSQLERRDFYRLVLGEEPPGGIDDKQSIFDILF